MMDYHHLRSSKLKLMKSEWRFIPRLLPQVKINLLCYLHLNPSDLILGEDDLSTPLRFTRLPSSQFSTSSSLTILQRGPIPYSGVREAAAQAAFSRLLRHERTDFIDLVVKEVRNKFRKKTLPQSGEFVVDLHFRLDLTNVFVVGSHHHRPMLPAADSSIGLLEKGGDDCLSCCCICMEELDAEAAAALRMPCSHVFHGGCIEKWLQTSHYCPLCRYEMPTYPTTN